jgi:hypothetical protein
MAIANTRLTTTGITTVYTSSGNNAITTIIVCNTGTVDLTDETVQASDLDLYLVPFGFSGDTPNTQIISKLTIPAGETVFFSEERVVLSAGDTVQAKCSSTGGVGGLLTITVSTLPV